MELKCFYHIFISLFWSKNVFHIIAVELVIVSLYIKTVMNRYFPTLQAIILWISLLCIISSSAESALFRASENSLKHTLSRYDLWYSDTKFRHCTLYCHFVDSRAYRDTNNLKEFIFSHKNWRFYSWKLSLSKNNEDMRLF